MRRTMTAIAAACVLSTIAFLLLPASVASAATRNVCSSGGLSDTTLYGGLFVTGDNYCTLDHVTVNGGIVVDGGSDVDLESSVVHGGVLVTPGGEIEVGVSLFRGVRTTSTVYGGITLHSPTDWDIETAHIFDGVTITNQTAPAGAGSSFGGNDVFGGLRPLGSSTVPPAVAF